VEGIRRRDINVNQKQGDATESEIALGKGETRPNLTKIGGARGGIPQYQDGRAASPGI